MTRTCKMLHNQQRRAKALGRHLDYDLERLRQEVEAALSDGCPYCRGDLTPGNFSGDHDLPISRGGSFALDNVVICCAHCNEAKGPLTGDEFLALMAVLLSFPADSRCNVIRRLRAGARAINRR